MKKIFLVLGAASLVMFAACNKENSIPQEHKTLSITATVEQHENPNATKTALDGTSVVWTAGDAIKVFDASGKTGKLTADAAGSSAHFTQVGALDDGFDETGTIYAFYPYDAATGASGSTITFTLPDTQTYVANSFDPACNVAVGVLSDGNVSFKNAFGLLKISLTGVMTVGKIELTTKGSEKLWGTFSANAASGYTATYSSGGSTTLILDCDNEGGVVLDAVTAKDFYFVVPNGAFASGFDAVVYDIDGYSNVNLQITVYTGQNNAISRSRIRVMPAIGTTLVPTETYTAKHYIESAADAQQYINTGFNPKGSSRAIADFQYNDKGTGTSKILGSRDGVDTHVFVLTSGGGTPRFEGAYNNNAISGNGIIVADTNRHLIDFNKGVTTVDGVTTSSYSSADFTTTYPVYLFAANYEGTSSTATGGGSYGKMYSVRLYDDGTLSHFFIPAQKGVEIGLYDCVSGNFYTNSGTGSFTAAATVLDVTFHK